MAPIKDIYEKYYKDIYRFSLALSKNEHTAEDIAQETFVKAIKGIDKFKGECDIKSWLCQIAKNTYFTYEKKQQKENVDVEDVIFTETSDCDLVMDFIDAEQAMKIHQILHKLNEPYKEVFNLRVFGELSFKQIASIFGKTESFARVTYHRARLMILKEIEEL